MSHDSETMMPLKILQGGLIVTWIINIIILSLLVVGVVENISRKPPYIGWIRLNTDDVSKGGFIASCGGVLRGENGEWICGSSKGLGSCDAYIAELWGVFDSLKLVRTHGFHIVELHVDSWVVATTLSSSEVGTTG